MKKPFSLLLLLFLPTLLTAEDPASAAPAAGSSVRTTVPSLLSLQALPSVNAPMGGSSAVFGMGGAFQLGAEYRLPSLPLIYLSGTLDYGFQTAKGISQSMSLTSASFGSGARLDLAQGITVKAGLSAG